MDPLSITAATVAFLTSLWKIGVKTADLISTYRDFDDDSKALERRIRKENDLTRALHMLLFEPSRIYGGNCIFDQFDVDIQDQIRVSLEQAMDTLNQAHQLLERRQRVSVEDRATDSKFPLLPTISPQATLSLSRLKWSLRDKKRLERIILDFSEHNSAIHVQIKVWCLSMSAGVNLHHLKHLEEDENSRLLGFHVDASLLRANVELDRPHMDLEVHGPDVTPLVSNCTPFGDKFAVCTQQGRPTLLEYRAYAPDIRVPVEPDNRTRQLVNSLANLLHQPTEVTFRTPHCNGWITQMQYNRVAFMFSIPEGVEPTPFTLLQLLSSKDLPSPSLSDRLQLALSLARCISQLQLVKWVHESFRSENIMFFPRHSIQDETHSPEDRIALSQPWVFGFEFSRPDPFFSDGRPDMCLSRDIYRHPERQQNPTHQFSKIHDIYALGVVLLEIGLWQPALSLEKSGFSRVKDPRAIQKYLVKQAERRLASRAGERYKDVVLKCLQGDFGVTHDTRDDTKLQQAFRSQVVDVLQRSASNI
ncbi:hypothetical protein QBC40DRAFT_340368 [Triangularia verruculosa]|uniref:DUF7580 domain-containing protein n=1 Tax=Triangularia verruculosa TaxID=2587418 RepID=A0AAN6XG62_9PEZI|nr:hypothetical protein QBC40DRAFT_340368 [Triangularia verruculosa]